MEYEVAVTIPDKLASIIRAHRRPFIALVVLCSVMTWSVVGASAWLARDVVNGLPDNKEIREVGTMATATTLLDVNDRQAFTIFQERRIEVPLTKVSPNVVKAIVAVEDQRFFDHGGFDVVRVAGAAMTNLREGRAAEGGSTITQQLARQTFLTPDKTIRRKLKEIVVAARIERQFTKEEILGLYLNKVYFGDGLYGVEAASLGYFGKHAADLTVAEAALIAGLAKSPSTYAPTVSLERAVTRRNVVLEAMRNSKAIDAATYQAAVDAPVVLDDTLRKDEAYGQYFKEEVRKELVQRFGWERVYQGGLKVYTTLDMAMQKAAESEVRRTLADIEQRQLRRRRKDDAGVEPLQAALVAMDPRTGEVRALVGGRNFKESRFNRATQAKRQAGSAFKPFVYAAALERGYSPATLITNLHDPIMTYQGAWSPEDEHLKSSSMTIRTALRTSSNKAAVRMMEDVGLPTTMQFARRLGVGDVPSVPSLALGSGEVTLMAMTAAYASFANDGMRPIPSLIRRVETNEGEILYAGGEPPQRAVSEATAFLMSGMLADVINSGTAWPARRVGFTLPAAGKTGTTNDYRDAWFVGYTPNLVAGVWVGYDKPKTIVANGYAAELAVPLWGRFMISATRGHRQDWFQPPATVTTATICRLSGKLATDACRNAADYDSAGYATMRSHAYTEHFIRGTEPSEYCPIHRYGGDGGFFGAVASVFGGGGGGGGGTVVERREEVAMRPDPQAEDRPVVTGGTVPPPGETATVQTPAGQPGQPQQPRRGFWGRVFRR